MNQIPLLQANDIECRIQSVSKNRSGEVGAVLLLYKNARVDMRILDEVYGQFGWQRTYELINGNLFCTIELWDAEKKQWIKKQDVGVPSNTEAEKGEASDASKRASTCVGIGRELYTSPFIYVKLNEGEYYEAQANGKTVYRASSGVRFTVSDIEYNERREIVGLVIKDRKGGVAFTYGSNKQSKASNTPKEKTVEKAAEKPTGRLQFCEICGKAIQPYGNYTAEQVMETTFKAHGKKLCIDCGKAETKRKKEAVLAEAAELDKSYQEQMR